MKRVSLALLVIILTHLTNYSYSQEHLFPWDNLDVINIAFTKNPGAPSNKTPKFYAGGNPTELVKAMGKPISITSEVSPFDDSTYTVYNYNGARFTFLGNQFSDLYITKPGFYLITNTKVDPQDPYKYHFRIGDDITKIKNIYPKSFKHRSADGTAFNIYLVQKKTIQNKDKSSKVVKSNFYLDMGLAFKVKDNKITHIIFGDN